MAFTIVITEDADRQLRWLPAREQRILEAAILSRLEHEPTTPTRAIKRLRPNPLAQFERGPETCAPCIMSKETKLWCW
jgi:mRNA-degrading endonuclease RelE of RelBE toxin-antitoxin system